MTGRPTKFTQDMIEAAESYINGGYRKDDKVIPSMVGLARKINIAKSTLYEWMNDKDHPLSDTLRKVAETQEEELLNGGLSGKFNSNITKLALGNHGYSEKRDNNNTGGINITISKQDAEIV